MWMPVQADLFPEFAAISQCASQSNGFHLQKKFQNPWRDWAAENALDR